MASENDPISKGLGERLKDQLIIKSLDVLGTSSGGVAGGLVYDIAVADRPTIVKGIEFAGVAALIVISDKSKKAATILDLGDRGMLKPPSQFEGRSRSSK